MSLHLVSSCLFYMPPPPPLLLPNPCKTCVFSQLVYHLLCSSFSLSCYLATIPDINRLLAVRMHSSLLVLSCQSHNVSPFHLHYPVIHSLFQFPIFPFVAQIIYYKMGHARFSLFPCFVHAPVIHDPEFTHFIDVS